MVINNRNITYAGFWRRLNAFNIDAVLFLIFDFLFEKFLSFSHKMGGVDTERVKNISGPIFLILLLLYFIVLESSSKQATLGKRFLGIKVTDINGERITLLHATGRTFAKLLSAVIFYIGFFMAGFTKKKQALHDILTSCLVVRIKGEYQ